MFLYVYVISFYFSFLISLATTSSTMLNSSDESGHSCLVPDFREKVFSLLPLNMVLAVGFYRCPLLL